MTGRALARPSAARAWQWRRLARHGVHYAALAGVAAILLQVDWAQLADQFAQADLARALFPQILTVALVNTLVYTLSGFASGWSSASSWP